MAGLTMDYESTPQVKQPENPMKSIEYKWPSIATYGNPLTDWNLLNLLEPTGTYWPIGTRWNPAGGPRLALTIGASVRDEFDASKV